MLSGLLFAALLAGQPEAGPPAAAAPAPPSVVEALAAEVRSVPPPSVAGLVACDPRFAALGPAEREALLEAVAIAPGWHVAASAANLVVGFGVGSLFESDLRGLVLTVTDAVAAGFLLAALVELSSSVETGAGSTTAMEAAPVAVVVLVAGRIAGLILPWTWNGRHHAAVSAALGTLPPPPPPASALLVAPLVASAGGRAAAGLTLVLRF